MGDSIVEHWLGTDWAEYADAWAGNNQVYQELFRQDDSYIHGLAFGIGGDQCPNVLYRLQHGEMLFPGGRRAVAVIALVDFGGNQ